MLFRLERRSYNSECFYYYYYFHIPTYFLIGGNIKSQNVTFFNILRYFPFVKLKNLSMIRLRFLTFIVNFPFFSILFHFLFQP